MATQISPPSYRFEAFRHWLNLGVVVAGVAFGLIAGPLYWVATAGIEAAVLWVVPDIPQFRKFVEKKDRAKRILDERAYYLDQLFGLADVPGAKQGFLKRLFFQGPEVELDSRVLRRGSKACHDYMEMREIVRKLNELKDVRGVRLQESDLNRMEVVINGYLRLLIACEPLQQAVEGLDVRKLQRDVQDIEAQLPKSDAAVRPALVERLRLARTQLERQPKLEATLQLFRTRADASVQQLRQIHGQVLADPGVDMSTVLDDLMEKQELLTDPLGQLAADQMVRDVLSATPLQAPAGVDRLRENAAAAKTAASAGRPKQGTKA